MKDKKIVLCLSGSIAAYKVCDLISELRKQGARLDCVLTQGALQFITALTVRSLSGGKVYTGQFEEFDGVLHTTLADKADLIVVAPASANIIARLANGFADDLATSIVLASKAKVLIIPAMNDNMYQHPITRENCQKLESIGYHFVRPVKGPLVCGRDEIGHIASLQEMLDKIKELLQSK